MRLFFAFFVSVNKKDKFSSFISTYGTVMKRGVLYYRIRIKDANGKLVAIYAKTPEELYNKETLALEQINLYCSRQRTIMYSVDPVSTSCHKSFLLKFSLHLHRQDTKTLPPSVRIQIV